MATITDISTTELSGQNYIDSLLMGDGGLAWNWITTGQNVIYYTFSTTTGTDSEKVGLDNAPSAFNSIQQQATREILAYVQQLTGIVFQETSDGNAADIHFASANLTGEDVAGLTTGYSTYTYDSTVPSQITSYSNEVYVYLDNVEFLALNQSPIARNEGYQILLHEIGHAMGLKHPFEGSPLLAYFQDSTFYTVMSYNWDGGPYSTFRPYDLSALMWLYGDDGLGGEWGLGTSGRYFLGTFFNDVISGTTGRDKILGQGGDDIVYGGDGNDVIYGNDGNDRIYGESGDNYISGDVGNDDIFGWSGNETLLGGDGNDFITGGDGNDIINAGKGDDVISNYARTSGGDIYQFSQGDGNDYIVNSTFFSDDIGENNAIYFMDSTSSDSLSFLRLGNDLKISYGVGDSIVIQDCFSSTSYSEGTYASTVNLIEFSNGSQLGLDQFLNQTITVGSDDNDSIAGYDKWVNYISGNGGDDFITGGQLADTIFGGDGNDYIASRAGNDSLDGGAGDDYLDGGDGLDLLVGGNGDDTYYIDSLGDVAIEQANGGNDFVYSSVTYSMVGSNIETLMLTGDSAVNGFGDYSSDLMIGNDGSNSLNGGAGNDTLDGGLGADVLNGGYGDDVFFIDNALDTVIEGVGEGIDTIKSSVSYKLESYNVENLTLIGSGSINATGNSNSNIITGNNGNDYLSGDAGDDILESVGGGSNTLDGGSGADTMIGSSGTDTYMVDNVGDVVVEPAFGGGLSGIGDLVISTISYSLGSSVSNLTLSGILSINGTGNDNNNIITGNAAANLISGGGGYDTLDGGTGSDTLVGGMGGDTYIVNSVGDVIVELIDEGVDTVKSSISYTLVGTYLENVTLLGNLAINATGNQSSNVLKGNSSSNTLIGNGGSDTIDGGEGKDTLIGGAGDDLYLVDGSADAITENKDEGVDSVNSSATYTLGDNIENLILTGITAINGSGNSLSNDIVGNWEPNVLVGNAGNDTLDGGGSADTLIGGSGNDVYFVSNVDDVINELVGDGLDTVNSTVSYTLGANQENINLLFTYFFGFSDINGTGNELSNVLVGNSGVNVLTGNAGNDTIDGGAGIDMAKYSGNQSSYAVLKSATDIAVTDRTGNDGVDSLKNIERLQFADRSLALDLDGNAGITAKILGAVFGTASLSNEKYVGIGLNLLDGGMSYTDLMQFALNEKLGEGFSNADEVNLLCQNLVGILPSTADLNYWVGKLYSGQFNHTSLAIMAADLDLNATNINLIGLQQTGIEYIQAS